MNSKGLLLILMVLVFAATGCKKTLNPRVKYFVDGTSSTFSVTYKDNDGQIIALDTVGYGWSVSFTGKKGDDLFFSATSHETNCWTKVYIYIDGKLLGYDYQFGDYTTATLNKKLKLVF